MKKLFSLPIIKQSLKSAWVWWLVSSIVISINLLAFPSLENIDSSELLKMFADSGIGGNGVIFITICAILFANIFITSEIDRGSLAVTLNTPTTRKQIILSKALVYIALMITISLFAGVIGTLSPIMYGIEFDHGKWWMIIVLWLSYSFAIGGITFFIGCFFNKSRFMLGTSAIILGAFFLFNMLALMDSFKFCKYLTLQTLFDMLAVIDGKNVIWQLISLLVIGIPFYLLGIVKFLKKDLPI